MRSKDTSTFDGSDEVAPARARRRPALAVFVVASLALHVALFAGLPLFPVEPEVLPATVLDVVLVSPAPTPPVRSESPAPPPKKPAAPEARPREQAAAPRPEPIAPTPIAPAAPKPPEPASEPMQPAPARAQPSTDAGAAPREAQPAQRPAAVASVPEPSPTPAPPPVTPPQFNAAYLNNPPPRYPVIARRRGEEGTVTLRVHVRRDGVPASVAVEKSSGSEALDTAALDAVRGWRFAPARRGEERIDAWVLVPVVFRLEGAS